MSFLGRKGRMERSDSRYGIKDLKNVNAVMHTKRGKFRGGSGLYGNSWLIKTCTYGGRVWWGVRLNRRAFTINGNW